MKWFELICFVLIMSICCPADAGKWTAHKVHNIDGFSIPECVVLGPDGKLGFVSNVVAKREGEGYDRFWVDDGTGFISRISAPDGLDVLKWRSSSEQVRLSGPKGMCIHDGAVWVTNNTHVVCFSLDGDSDSKLIKVPGAQALNDMATDGKAAYVTDIKAGKAYRLNPGGKHHEIKAPDGINGITFFQDKMFAASWGMRDLYELDPSGKGAPRSFGLKDHFTTPDGIEVLEDGSFIVSDSEGGKVAVVAADEKTVYTLLELPAPADIALDRKRLLLYVPLFFEGRVEVFQLKK